MTGTGDNRGILYPNRLPSFYRAEAPIELQAVIRWFWIPQWQLAPGRTSRQEILPFPASNLVVEPDGVSLSGPTTALSHRDLRGTGWAVGALLRPAGLAVICREPGAIRDAEISFDAPDLHHSVRTAMTPDRAEHGSAAAGRAAGNTDLHPDASPDSAEDASLDSAEEARLDSAEDTSIDPAEDASRCRTAVRAWVDWAGDHFTSPDETALLANAMEDLIAADSTVVGVDQVAGQLGISTRSVQRLARRYVGMPPLAIIRRYRLQEAVQRLRQDPTVTIADVAAELGYADHAHLATDFRRVMGFTPTSYRKASDTDAG